MAWHMAFQWHSTWAKRVDLSRKLDIPKGTNWNLEPKDTNRECQAIAWLAPAELVRSFGDLQASAVASNVPQPTWEFKPCFEAWRLFFRCLHLESTDQYRSISINIGQYWSISINIGQYWSILVNITILVNIGQMLHRDSIYSVAFA